MEIDKDKNGFLSYDEVLGAYKEYYGDGAEEQVENLFKICDIDKSGQIDFSECLAASVNKATLLQDEKLKAAFDYYDKDGSGSISTEEIKQVIGVGKNIKKEVWDEVIKEIDENGDGEVQFDEFKTMMHSLLK